MLMIFALGGNAVSLPDREGNIADQFAATRHVAGPVADLVQQGHRLVITHGNGPQVGQVMRRVEIAAEHHVYRLPLDIVVADTEAGMGYMISQCLMNELAARGVPRLCTTIITTVRVDANDPAMLHPAKPVGPFMTFEQADRHVREDRWNIVEDAGRGYRRVVPSPVPLEIVELPLLKKLVAAGELILAAGGGGIPVLKDDKGMFRGVEAVIDKDYTSGLLASELEADRLVILTGVDQVQRDFGTPSARPIECITAIEAQQLLDASQFPPGSMGPKIRASIRFLATCRNPAAEVLITSCERAADALLGRTGTRIVRSSS